MMLRLTESAYRLHKPDKLSYAAGNIKVKWWTLEHQKWIIVLKNSTNSCWMKRHMGKHWSYYLKIALMQEKKIKYIKELSNHSVSLEKSTNWVVCHSSQKQLEKTR